MHKPASVLENDTQKLQWDFGIQTDHLTSTTTKKRLSKIADLAVPVDHRIKLKECEKKDKYLDLARELKETMEHEGDAYTNRD